MTKRLELKVFGAEIPAVYGAIVRFVQSCRGAPCVRIRAAYPKGGQRLAHRGILYGAHKTSCHSNNLDLITTPKRVNEEQRNADYSSGGGPVATRYTARALRLPQNVAVSKSLRTPRSEQAIRTRAVLAQSQFSLHESCVFRT